MNTYSLRGHAKDKTLNLWLLLRLPLLFSFFFSAPAFAEPMHDAAWETYVTAQKKFQNAIHHHLKLMFPELRELLEESQELQLALVDEKSMRFYHLLSETPERIVRDEGFSAFVNFAWDEEDDTRLLAEDKEYAALRRRIEKLRGEVLGDPQFALVEEKLSQFKETATYDEVRARFRFTSQEVEELLFAEKGHLSVP
jgi:hypothetical protein